MAFINLNQLTKAVKGLVNKINLENYIISDKLGNLSNLDTSDKSNLVAAINEVMDNSTTNYTQLTNKPSINNVTLSGNKTASDLGLAPAGAYVKPSGGIPASDLASAVQTSLGKADTALQSYTETDPTVPAWAKAPSKPTYTASEVGAVPLPSGYGDGDIPFFDYNSGTWLSNDIRGLLNNSSAELVMIRRGNYSGNEEILCIEETPTFLSQRFSSNRKTIFGMLDEVSGDASTMTLLSFNQTTGEMRFNQLDGDVVRLYIFRPETVGDNLYMVCHPDTDYYRWDITDYLQNSWPLSDSGKVLTVGSDGVAAPADAPVRSVNNKTGVVTLTAADVGAYAKPSGGIPASDLDSNSQSAITTAERLKQGLNGEGFVWAYTENDELYFSLVDSGDLAPRTLFLNLDSTETIVSAQYTAADLMTHYQARPTVWWLLDENQDLVAVLYPTFANTTTGEITFSSIKGTTVYDVSIHPDPDNNYESMIGTLVKHQILTPEIGDAVTYDLKQALLQLAQKIAYIDDGGQTYYKALYDALFPPQPAASITAVYTQSGTVWSDDDLDNLKADLTVTAIYADGSSSAPIDPEDYTLSGSLDAASSTVTVSYTGKTTTFPVTVTMVGDTEYASDVRNFRLSSETGSSGMGADYLWLKCVSSSMISSYTSWAFDCKKTLWDTVKGKRLRVRASLMSPDWTGDPGAKNCILASFGIFSSAGITGGSGRQKWHRFDTIYNLPSEYTTYEFVFDATLDNMDGGSGTPTANSTCGLVLYSQTLNELRCNAVSVREVLST